MDIKICEKIKCEFKDGKFCNRYSCYINKENKSACKHQ